MFSFGGELKAYPDSPYVIQNNKLNISDPTRLNNNNFRQYHLRGSLIEYAWSGSEESWQVVNIHNFLEDIPFHNLISCNNAKMSLKLFVERDDWKYPGDDYANNKNNNFWGNCSPAERSNKSKYEINMRIIWTWYENHIQES